MCHGRQTHPHAGSRSPQRDRPTPPCVCSGCKPHNRPIRPHSMFACPPRTPSLCSAATLREPASQPATANQHHTQGLLHTTAPHNNTARPNQAAWLMHTDGVLARCTQTAACLPTCQPACLVTITHNGVVTECASLEAAPCTTKPTALTWALCTRLGLQQTLPQTKISCLNVA